MSGGRRLQLPPFGPVFAPQATSAHLALAKDRRHHQPDMKMIENIVDALLDWLRDLVLGILGDRIQDCIRKLLRGKRSRQETRDGEEENGSESDDEHASE